MQELRWVTYVEMKNDRKNIVQTSDGTFRKDRKFPWTPVKMFVNVEGIPWAPGKSKYK